jgi:DNA-binding XRE family transcriptional regulator
LTPGFNVVYIIIMQSETLEMPRQLKNNLAALRGERSVQDIARAIGVTRKTIYDAESGHSMPRPETLAALIRLFGSPVVFDTESQK